MNFLKLPHTPESVAEELIRGLEDGSLTLGNETAVPERDLVTREIEETISGLAVLVEGERDKEWVLGLLRNVVQQISDHAKPAPLRNSTESNPVPSQSP